MVPEGWRVAKLGELFETRRERGKCGLPTLSVTLDAGLVLRDSLDRKTDTTLSPEEHLLVKEGDIAYNMMRMWQGASGLASCDALVSPAYVVLRPKTVIDPLFAAHFFKAARTIYLFWAYSHGLTDDRLRLYFHDFSLIPVAIPQVAEQRMIGHVLQTWHDAIATVEKLIESSERQNKALLQHLFDRARRVSPLAEHALGALGATYGGLTGKTKDDFGAGAPYVPYNNVFQNSRFDPGYLDYVSIAPRETQNQVRFGDVLVTTSSETPDEVGMTSVVLDEVERLYLNSFCFGLRLNDFSVLLPEYARYLFRSPGFRRRIFPLAQGSTRYNLAKSEFLKLRVSLPSLQEQAMVAKVLATAEAELAKERDLLARLEMERSALMQQLLTGKRRLRVDVEQGQVACA